MKSGGYVTSNELTGVTPTTTSVLDVFANAAAGTGAGTVDTIASEKDIPWGLAVLPGGDALYTNRDAFTVIRLSPSGKKTTVGKIPGVVGTNGEGGLLGLELSPTFASDNWVYI